MLFMLIGCGQQYLENFCEDSSVLTEADVVQATGETVGEALATIVEGDYRFIWDRPDHPVPADWSFAVEPSSTDAQHCAGGADQGFVLRGDGTGTYGEQQIASTYEAIMRDDGSIRSYRVRVSFLADDAPAHTVAAIRGFLEDEGRLSAEDNGFYSVGFAGSEDHVNFRVSVLDDQGEEVNLFEPGNWDLDGQFSRAE